MMATIGRHRICSFDMVELAIDEYVLAEEDRATYFCNARSFCPWVVYFGINR